ncbi:glycoprotein Xg isoform X2 [Pelobates fuscus]|uniref:glycoprotein Xg isoform X2 n=1 Tax=Pelobates fuscus TaxID=191477 RepID=UPI002FE4A1DC
MFWRLAILCLLLVAVEIRGQDFDLSEALDKPVETTPNKPASPTDGSPNPTKKPAPKPKPENPGTGGGKTILFSNV